MFRSSSSHPILFIALMIVTLLVCSTGMAQNYVAPSTPVIGSANTVTANAPVPRPTTQPCTVTLFQNYDFNDFNPPVDCNGSIFEERIQEGSVRPGAASSSAKTGAAITRVPRLKAVSRAFWANELREGFLSHKAIITF